MRMSFMSLGAGALALVAAVGSNAHATVLTGSLSTATGGLLAGGNYATGGFVISWNISDNPNGTWNYNYTFTRPNGSEVSGPAVSHIILQLSQTFTPSDLLSFNNSNIESVEFGSFGPGPSNPGIPGSLSGLKFNTDDPFTISFVTTRAPMWGSFYVKGGSSSFAFNEDFGAIVANPNNYNAPAMDALGNLLNMILVPNTVPAPTAAGVLALGGLVATRRRRR